MIDKMLINAFMTVANQAFKNEEFNLEQKWVLESLNELDNSSLDSVAEQLNVSKSDKERLKILKSKHEKITIILKYLDKKQEIFNDEELENMPQEKLYEILLSMRKIRKEESINKEKLIEIYKRQRLISYLVNNLASLDDFEIANFAKEFAHKNGISSIDDFETINEAISLIIETINNRIEVMDKMVEELNDKEEELTQMQVANQKELTQTKVENHEKNYKLEELDIFTKEIHETLETGVGFKVSEVLEFYSETGICLSDEFYIETKKKIRLSPIILKNSEGVICYFSANQRKDTNKYWLTMDARDCNFGKLENAVKGKLIVFEDIEENNFLDSGNILEAYTNPNGKSKCKGDIIDVDISYNEMKTPDGALCIDFGTSSTSLGSYVYDYKTNKYEEKIVKFYDKKTDELVEILPTVIFVKDITQEKIEYKFGYDAINEIENRDFYFVNSMFFEIKKWISDDVNKKENLLDDKSDKKVTVSRKEIIKAYLDYVIERGEEYFKMKFERLHFSAPVKLKSKYLRFFKDLYDGIYEIETEENSLDEGVSIIYNKLHSLISESKNANSIEPKGKIVILDCGGGTTDVASCSYEIENNNGTKIKMKTSYEEGDSNFGGNSLTYLIMKYLKLKLCEIYQTGIVESNLENLLKSKEEIKSIIDNFDFEGSNENGDLQQELSDILKDFDYNYELAEKIIPTKFSSKTSEFNSKQDKEIIKRNFYQLWFIADKVKTEFFKQSNIVMIGLDKEDNKNKKIKLPNLDKIFLSYYDNNNKIFTEIETLPELTITLEEIRTLIMPSIYMLLEKVLEGGNVVKDIDLFELTGQTCKIDLFEELLKEFVPGKKLRQMTSRRKIDNNSLDKKLKCLKGAIQFKIDFNSGYIDKSIENENSKLLYSVYSEGQEIFGDMVKLVEVHKDTKFRNFEIKNSSKKTTKTLKYLIDKDEKKETNLEEILGSLSNFAKDKEEDIKNLLAKASKEKYLMITLPCKDGFSFDFLTLYKNADDNFSIVKSEIQTVENIDYGYFDGDK